MDIFLIKNKMLDGFYQKCLEVWSEYAIYTWLVETIPTFIEKPAEYKNLSKVKRCSKKYYFWY